jgi:DNA helicase-2/ATP-dependent DNA helicase PcrA
VKLNKEQQQAVDLTEEPVVVIAGPGTGKTELIARKVQKICMTADNSAKDILCVTFSDAGAKAMRKRIRKYIGPEADKVSIHTFHSFCNMVIQQNMPLIGNPDMSPASTLDRMNACKRAIDRLPVGHPLRFSSIQARYTYLPKLLSLFSFMKKNGLSKSGMIAKLNQSLIRVQDDPEYRYKRNTKYGKKGEVNQRKIDSFTDNIHKVTKAVELFDVYNQELGKMQVYDYDDMINWVVNGFRDFPFMLLRYQEQFLYFLVDEFQDTNPSQLEVIMSLASYYETPNLTVVGDPDQSLYEFQGARIDNFDKLIGLNPTVIKLQENYRSPQGLIDAAYKVVSNNQLRIVDATTGLNAVSSSKGLCSVFSFDSPLKELSFISSKANEALSNGSSVAILYSKHRQADAIVRSLSYHDVPFEAQVNDDLFLTGPWRSFELVLNFIAAADKGSEHKWMPEIILDDIIGTGGALSFLVDYRTAQRDNLSKEIPYNLRDHIEANATTEEGRLIDACYRLYRYSKNNHIVSLFKEFVSMLVKDIDEEHVNPMCAIDTWLTELFVSNKNISATDVLDQKKLLHSNRIRMSVPTVYSGGDVTSGKVEVMSVYAAKGLEWDEVFLYDSSDSWLPGRATNSFSLPDEALSGSEYDRDESSRRAWFVGMTRAKQNLYATYSSIKMNSKDQLPVVYSVESEIPVIEIDGQPECKSYLSNSIANHDVNSINPDKIDELIDGFVWSASSLLSYLKCPREFFFKYLLKIPMHDLDQLVYGEAIHEAINKRFKAMKRSESEEFPPKEILISDFKAEMEARRASMTSNGFSTYLEEGEDALTRLADSPGEFIWPTRSLSEMYVSAIIGEVPVKGVIDLLIFGDDLRVKIRDWKSGKASRRKVFGPTDRYPTGSNYYLQLGFYGLLVDYSKEMWVSDEAEIFFIEKDGADYLVVPVDLKEAKGVAFDYLGEANDRVKQHDFSGCNEKDCQWCS